MSEANRTMIKTLHKFYASRPRLFDALAVGIVAGFAIPLPDGDPVMHVLIGWNVAVYVFLVVIWIMMLRAGEGDVRSFAKKQDEKAYAILIALTLAALMSLVAIVIELAGASATSSSRPFHIAIAASTVLGSWFLIPTVFGLHYAHEYYQADRGATTLVFPEANLKPDYWDFMYFSFTIAVAFATSDIEVTTRGTRKLVLAQSVLSFFFNASILALSINISASLVSN